MLRPPSRGIFLLSALAGAITLVVPMAAEATIPCWQFPYPVAEQVLELSAETLLIHVSIKARSCDAATADQPVLSNDIVHISFCVILKDPTVSRAFSLSEVESGHDRVWTGGQYSAIAQGLLGPAFGTHTGVTTSQLVSAPYESVDEFWNEFHIATWPVNASSPPSSEKTFWVNFSVHPSDQPRPEDWKGTRIGGSGCNWYEHEAVPGVRPIPNASTEARAWLRMNAEEPAPASRSLSAAPLLVVGAAVAAAWLRRRA